MVVFRLRLRQPGTLSEPPSRWKWLENEYQSRTRAEAARRDIFRSHGGQLEVVIVEQAAPLRERHASSLATEAPQDTSGLEKRASAG